MYPELNLDAPLHFPGAIQEWEVWACQADYNYDICYDWRCEECVEVAATVAVFDPDHLMAWRPDPREDNIGPVTLSWLVERSQFWFREMDIELDDCLDPDVDCNC